MRCPRILAGLLRIGHKRGCRTFAICRRLHEPFAAMSEGHEKSFSFGRQDVPIVGRREGTSYRVFPRSSFGSLSLGAATRRAWPSQAASSSPSLAANNFHSFVKIYLI